MKVSLIRLNAMLVKLNSRMSYSKKTNDKKKSKNHHKQESNILEEDIKCNSVSPDFTNCSRNYVNTCFSSFSYYKH